MELAWTLREINPLIDEISRGKPVNGGPAFALAVGLGLLAPEGRLTEAGLAYASPEVADGPAALVMSPSRREAARLAMAGALPLPAALRRLLRRILEQGEQLVSPLAVGWPETLLRTYLAYLVDLGLLVAVGPLVEVTPAGRALAARADPEPVWPAWGPPEAEIGGGTGPGAEAPSFRSPLFRYHLARRVCMALLTLRGKREWHRLQPLLDGPLTPLHAAWVEWFTRFQRAQHGPCRTWSPERVAKFEARIPYPDWFGRWTVALLSAEPADVADALAASPLLLSERPVLHAGLPDRSSWLVAIALGWVAPRGRLLLYDQTAARLRQDGILLPAWTELHATLEVAGLLVSEQSPARLLLPVQVCPPAGSIWPYGSPDLLTAALLEGGAVGLPDRVRRPMPI